MKGWEESETSGQASEKFLQVDDVAEDGEGDLVYRRASVNAGRIRSK